MTTRTEDARDGVGTPGVVSGALTLALALLLVTAG